MLESKKMGTKVSKVIAGHNVELVRLSNESDLAIDTFQQTVVKLQEINNQIDDSISLVDTQMTDLTKIKTSMLEKKTRNEKVKTKIQEFLS